MRAVRSGRFTTASLDAQTPGVRTTRFCRRGRPSQTFGSSRVLAPEAERKRCDHAVSIARIAMAHRRSPPCHLVTRRRYRVHRIPAYVS